MIVVRLKKKIDTQHHQGHTSRGSPMQIYVSRIMGKKKKKNGDTPSPVASTSSRNIAAMPHPSPVKHSYNVLLLWYKSTMILWCKTPVDTRYSACNRPLYLDPPPPHSTTCAQRFDTKVAMYDKGRPAGLLHCSLFKNVIRKTTGCPQTKTS